MQSNAAIRPRISNSRSPNVIDIYTASNAIQRRDTPQDIQLQKPKCYRHIYRINSTLPPEALKHRRPLHIPLAATTGQRRRAVHKLPAHAHHAHFRHSRYKSDRPCRLAGRKSPELNRSDQILRQIFVGGQCERSLAVDGLRVEFVVPLSWCGVECGSSLGGIGSALTGGGVGADESCEIDGGEAFGAEEFDKVAGFGVSGGEDAEGVGGAGVYSADLDGDGGATGTCLDCVCYVELVGIHTKGSQLKHTSSELNKIGYANLLLVCKASKVAADSL
jgi:hypothetical protein